MVVKIRQRNPQCLHGVSTHLKLFNGEFFKDSAVWSKIKTIPDHTSKQPTCLTSHLAAQKKKVANKIDETNFSDKTKTRKKEKQHFMYVHTLKKLAMMDSMANKSMKKRKEEEEGQ